MPTPYEGSTAARHSWIQVWGRERRPGYPSRTHSGQPVGHLTR